MKITVFCVFVAGQLAICFFVSCASDQCSSLTDCQSCLNQTSCTWLIYLNESSPSCKNYTTPGGKNQKCTAEDEGAALNLLAPNSTVTQTTTSVQTALTNISSAVGNTTSTSTTTTTMTTSSPLNTSAAVPKTTAVTHEGSRFDAGSFVGGMALALGMTLILFLGYKFSCYRGEVQYRTIEEHDAII